MTIVIGSDGNTAATRLPAYRDRGGEAPNRMSPEEEALIGVYPYSGADIKLVVHLPPQEENQESEDLIRAREELEQLERELEMSPQGGQQSPMTSRIESLRRTREEQYQLLQITPESEHAAIEADINNLTEQIDELTSEYNRAVRSSSSRDELQSRIEALSTQIEEEQSYSGTGTVTKTLAEITTLSISIHRDKRQVRTLGSTYLRSVTRGPRCLPATEKVLVRDKGYISISNVKREDYVQSSAGKYNKVLGSWYQGTKPCYHLRLENGYELTGSYDHPISTGRGWINLADLKDDDVVNTVGYSPLSEEDYPLEDELIKMVAYLIGDGQTHIYPKKDSNSKSHIISLSIADKEIESIGKDVHNCLEALGIGYTDSRKRNDKCIRRSIHVCEKGKGLTDWRLRVYNKLHQVLLEYDLYGKYSHQKMVPNEFISSLSERQICLFLNRLWATDGEYSISKDKKCIEAKYTSTSEALIDQVRLLLSKLGINCIKVKNSRLAGTVGGRSDIISRHNAHQLVISESFELVKFVKKVGIYGKDNKILNLIPLLISRVKNKTIFKNQGEFTDIVRSILQSRNQPVTSLISKYNLYRPDMPLTVRRAVMVANELKDKSLSQLVNKKIEDLINLRNKIIPRKIRSLEKTLSLPVYDLEVEDRHKFIANFIEVHNTVSGSMVWTVFHSHIMHEFLEATHYRSTGVGDWDRFRYTSAIMDQIPPLDISISFANEYGNISYMSILGVEFMNEGMVMSIEDLFMEGTAQYIARDYDPIRSVGNRPLFRNRGVGQELTGTSVMIDDLRRRLAMRNNPWI
jgi:intein/homing endonuclease